MIWSAVSWKWKHRRPSDSARLFFLMKAVWKSIWKRQGTFLRTPMKCGEHFPCTFILKAACGTRKKSAGKIELGSAESTAFFQEGRDELNFIGRENTGNYGITCHLTIHSKGTGKYDLYLNPNGGVFEGTLEIGQDRRLLRIYRTERYGTRWFGHDTIYDYEKLGTWEAGKDLYIRFIPPGACYFPIRLLFVPKK